MPPHTAKPSLRKDCVWPAAVSFSCQQIPDSLILPRDEPRVPQRPVRAGGEPTQALQQWLWLFCVSPCCRVGLLGSAAACNGQLRAHLYLPGRRQPGE